MSRGLCGRAVAQRQQRPRPWTRRRTAETPCSCTRSVALACKRPLNARLVTGVGLSFFLSFQLHAWPVKRARVPRGSCGAEAGARSCPSRQRSVVRRATLLRHDASHPHHLVGVPARPCANLGCVARSAGSASRDGPPLPYTRRRPQLCMVAVQELRTVNWKERFEISKTIQSVLRRVADQARPAGPWGGQPPATACRVTTAALHWFDASAARGGSRCLSASRPRPAADAAKRSGVSCLCTV
jgi:hypothetical protein